MARSGLLPIEPVAMEEPEVPVYVKEHGLDPIMILTRLSSSVADFKQVINARLWFDCNAQVLMFNGKKFQDGKSLAFYGVQEGSRIDLMERLGSGPPGGRCLFGHGLVVWPGRFSSSFRPRPGCCDPYVRFEMLKNEFMQPVDREIHVCLSPAALENGCWPSMTSYMDKESTICVMCDDQVLIEQSLEGGGRYLLIPPDGWKAGTEYTVLVRNCQGRGVGWTFRTKFIEK